MQWIRIWTVNTFESRVLGLWDAKRRHPTNRTVQSAVQFLYSSPCWNS